MFMASGGTEKATESKKRLFGGTGIDLHFLQSICHFR
jgi:hypothetical protein